MGFSRQEHWSGLPFPSPMREGEKWKWSRSVVSDPQRPHGLQPTRLLHPWDFPGKSTGVGCHCLLLDTTLVTFKVLWGGVNVSLFFKFVNQGSKMENHLSIVQDWIHSRWQHERPQYMSEHKIHYFFYCPSLLQWPASVLPLSRMSSRLLATVIAMSI